MVPDGGEPLPHIHPIRGVVVGCLRTAASLAPAQAAVVPLQRLDATARQPANHCRREDEPPGHDVEDSTRPHSNPRDVAHSHCYYLDIPIEDTLTRHATKGDLAYRTRVTERELRTWYRTRDLLPDGLETVIGADSTLTDTINRIMNDTGLAGLPAHDK